MKIRNLIKENNEYDQYGTADLAKYLEFSWGEIRKLIRVLENKRVDSHTIKKFRQMQGDIERMEQDVYTLTMMSRPEK